MNLDDNDRYTLAIDGGGRFAVKATGPTAGLQPPTFVVRERSCMTPGCPCRDMYLEVLIERHGTPSAGLQARWEAAESYDRLMHFILDVDTGLLRADWTWHDPEGPREFVEMFQGSFGHDELERCRRRWRWARREGQDAWRHRDWSDYHPGDMIPWVDLFPDAPNLIITMKAREILLLDSYCFTPSCRCKELVLELNELCDEGIERLGAARVSTGSYRVREILDSTIGTSRLRSMAKAALGSDRLRRDLTTRAREVRRMGPDLLVLTGHAPKPAAPATSKKLVGRNDPCPCGSGKKYKRCCGRQ